VFGQNEGVVVDTHVSRLAPRLGLTRQSDPVKIEQDLMRIVPRDQWSIFAHRLIWHGRRVCHAKKPDCENCMLAPLCPSASLGIASPAAGRSNAARSAGRRRADRRQPKLAAQAGKPVTRAQRAKAAKARKEERV
jgi:endonuclease-3